MKLLHKGYFNHKSYLHEHLYDFMYIRLIDHRSVPHGGSMGGPGARGPIGGPMGGPMGGPGGPRDMGLKDPWASRTRASRTQGPRGDPGAPEGMGAQMAIIIGSTAIIIGSTAIIIAPAPRSQRPPRPLWAPRSPCGRRRQAGLSDGALRAPCTSSPDRNLAPGTKVGRRRQAGRSDGALRAPCTSSPDRNLALEPAWQFVITYGNSLLRMAIRYW